MSSDPIGFKTAFVTGATGLLGSNLVRELVARGVEVRGLVRSAQKADVQFGGLSGVTPVLGDLADPSSYSAELAGVDVLFHTAAYFRDSYQGGEHRKALLETNVDGVSKLLEAAYAQGVRRFVHASSTAVLRGRRGGVADESMPRPKDDADDYYLSKILSDEAVFQFLAQHPDMFGALVLPGWMHGPGDMGPTPAGQLTLDYVRGKLPSAPPAGFALVDARDVALGMIAAAERGRRAERYLVAGRNLEPDEIMAAYAKVTGVAAPRRRVPMPAMILLGAAMEAYSRLSGKPVLLSWASVRMLLRERGRRAFSSAKAEGELGVRFRALETTLSDEVAWYRRHGYLPQVGPS